MCRNTKWASRLKECVAANTELGRPRLHALDDVIVAIRSDEDNNLDFAEKIIATYESTLKTQKVTHEMQKQSKLIVEEKRRQGDVYESFKESSITCTGAGGTILPFAVNAPTKHSTFLYFGLSQTGKESILKTHAMQKHIQRDHSNSLDDKLLGKLSYEIKENIFYQSTLSSVLTPEFVVSDWFGEMDNAYKKYPETTKDIGHFITVVSRSVDAVGVGMVKALNGLEYWVCQYRVRSPATFKPSNKSMDVDWDCFPPEVWDKIKQFWHSTTNYKAVLKYKNEH
jgi:hypothetical protein